MNANFTDALELIQRAEESMVNNSDSSYCEILGGYVASLKQQLSTDLALPAEFFEPVSTEESVEEVPVEMMQEAPANPELTPEAQKFYESIRIGMGA